MRNPNWRRTPLAILPAFVALPLIGCNGGGSSNSTTPQAIAAPQPQVEVVAVRDGSLDLRMSWSGAGSYHYSTATAGDNGWHSNGETQTGEVLLTDIPVDGAYRFCITGAQGESCTSFSSKVDEEGQLLPVSAPEAPPVPELELVAVDGQQADVRVWWTAPATGLVDAYHFHGGTDAGADWQALGTTVREETLLQGVPLGGEYWFCVSASNSGGTSVDSCADIKTPVAEQRVETGIAPTPQPQIEGAPVNECDNPRPEWIWCDDFEQDRMASYFEASMPRVDGVGRGDSTAVVGRYLLGASEAGNLKLAFGRTPGGGIRPADAGTANYREIYWRHYVKHPADWQGGGADKLSRATVFTSTNWQQAMIAHVWSGDDPGPQQNYLQIDPASGVSGSRIITQRYNDFSTLRWLGSRTGPTPLFDRDHIGEWHCVEARVRLNDPGSSNGIFELWVNGELETSRRDLNWVGSYTGYGINAVFLENFWNKRSPVEQERYMDNFVVSTQPIGC